MSGRLEAEQVEYGRRSRGNPRLCTDNEKLQGRITAVANKSRPKQLSFRVSEEEWELLQQKISESGMNQQRYILSCVLGKKVVNTDGIIAIMPELRRQGVNLNQIAQRLNERGYIDYKKELSTVLNEVNNVWQLLKPYLPELE